MDSLYPMEFLNTLQFNDIANHKLELKVGMPILLLRNLNQSIGLCNGMRLIVKRLGQCVIEAEIITRNNVANMCSYPASSCPPPGLIGHLFCVIVNFLFEWHLR
jgi:ATP-dependent DNA helicase PIF1